MPHFVSVGQWKLTRPPSVPSAALGRGVGDPRGTTSLSGSLTRGARRISGCLPPWHLWRSVWLLLVAAGPMITPESVPERFAAEVGAVLLVDVQA